MFRLPRASSLLAFGLSLFFTLSTASAVDLDPKSQSAIPGDFNGDGRMDALFQPLTAREPGAIVLQDGTGNLTVLAQQWDAGYLGLDWSTADSTLTAADLNGDGQDDVIMQPRKAGGTGAVLFTDPSIQLLRIGQLLPAGYLGLDWSSAANLITAGDFDGDRQKELLLQSKQKGGPAVMVHAAPTGQLMVVMQQFADGFLGRHWDAKDETFYVGDFNGDGRQDLLVQSHLNGKGEAMYALLLADPNGLFSHVAETWNMKDLGADWNPANHKIVISDANHDGIMDITLQSTDGGTNYLFEGNAQGQFAQPVAHWTGNQSASDVLNTGTKKSGTGTGVISVIPSGGSATANIITAPTNPEQNPTIPRGGGLGQGSGLIMTANAAGRLEGSGGVSGGTATYNIPIAVPPGINGMQPSISLNYSSRGGNGEMGMGWSLSAGSQIHRCPATQAMDGYSSGVTYTANDRLCLDGQHLIPVSGAYGANGTTYRTELDGFAIVVESGSMASSSSTFTVHQKNGHTLTYGGARRSTFTPSGASSPLAWGVALDLDTYQNSIFYTYGNTASNGFAPGEYLLTAINYTGTASTAGNREVDFAYSTRSDVSTQYLGGGLTTQSEVLSSITTSADSSPVRTYSMDYSVSATSGRTLLAGVQECAGVGSNQACLPETTFTWHDVATSFNSPLSYDVNSFDPEADDQLTAYSAGNLHQPYMTSPGDFDGDGRKELIYTRPGAGTYLLFLDAQGNVSSYSNMGALTDFGSLVTNAFGVYYTDIDGDGATDVVGAVLNGSQYLLEYSNYTGSSSNQGFSSPVTTSLVVPTVNLSGRNVPGIIAVTDVDGDGRPDVVMYTLDGSGNMHLEVAFNNTAPGGPVSFKAPVSMGFTLPANSSITPVGSLDGSGFQDFQVSVLSTYPSGGTATSGMQIEGWIFPSRDTTDQTQVDFQYQAYSALHVDNQAVDLRNDGMLMDINGDGLPDYVFACFATTGDWCYQLNTGAVGEHMFSDTVDTLQADIRGPNALAGSMQADIHNDGRQEVLYPDVMLMNYCIFQIVNEGGAGHDSEDGSEEECAVGGWDGKGLPANDDFSVYQYSALEFLPQADSSQSSGYRYVPIKSTTNIVGQSHQAVAIDMQGDGLNTITSAFSKWYLTGHFDAVAQFPNYVKPHGVAVAYNSETTVGGSGMSLNSAPDLMLSATDGLSQVEKWDYYPLSSDVQFNGISLYSVPAIGSPNRYAGAGSFYFSSSMYVVGDYKVSSGVGPLNEHDFHYAQAIYDGTGRGFQGFRTVVDDDMVTSARTVQLYHQRFPLSGLLDQSWTTLQDPGFNLSNPVYDPTDVNAIDHVSTTVACYYGAGAKTLASGGYTVDPALDNVTCTQQLDAPTYMPYVAEEKEHKQDTAGNRLSDTTTDYTYDLYGNDTDTHSVVTDDQGVYTKDAQTAFYAADTSTSPSDPTAWWLDKLQDTVTTVQATYNGAAQPSVSRETDYPSGSYDSGRSPTVVNSYVGDGNFARTTTYAYSLGNVTSVSVAPTTADPNTPARTTTTTYSTGVDANYFVASVKDPLNHITTTTADPRFGLPLTVTDPNNIKTTYTYDPFGRKTSVQTGSLPTQTTSYITSQSGDGMCDGMMGFEVGQYYVLVSQPGYPDHYTCYDMFNRALRSAHESITSNSDIVYTDTLYDRRGRVKVVTEPYFSGGAAPVLSNTNSYSSDLLGRVLTKFDAKGIETDYTYAGLVTDITTKVSPCPSGAVNCLRYDEEITNSLGKLISVTNAKGQSDPNTLASMQATTSYGYDSDGNPIAITAADGNVINASYNILGLKDWVKDPDQDVDQAPGEGRKTSYTYDAFGDLRTQTDALRQVLTMYYDAEGRMTSKTSSVTGEPTVTWTYDSFAGCSNAVGKLCDVTVADGSYEETYNYDGNGMIKADIENIGGTPYETDTVYDVDGRVDTVSYPQTLADQPPVANAGTLQYVPPNTTVTLDGSGSSDPDSGPQPLGYQWAQTVGPSVSLSNATTMHPSFTAGVSGTTYTFQLTVDDGLVSSVSSTPVNIVVPAMPAAPAAPTDDGDTNHDGSYTVSWTGVSVTGAVITYSLEEATGNSSGATGTWAPVPSCSPSSLSCPISHPGNGAYYYWYRVRAYETVNGVGVGYGPYSNTDDIHVVVTPGAPSSISPTTASTTIGTYSITWGAYTGSVISADVYYQLEVATNTGWTGASIVYTGTARSASFSNPLGDYYYRVEACNKDGTVSVCSAWEARAHEIVTGTGGGGCPSCQPQVVIGGGGGLTGAPIGGTSAGSSVAKPVLNGKNAVPASGSTAAPTATPAPASGTQAKAPKAKRPPRVVAIQRHSRDGRNPASAQLASTNSSSVRVLPRFAPPVYKAWANAKLLKATGTTSYAGFSVKYIYTGNGYLYQLADGVDPNRVYWQLNKNPTVTHAADATGDFTEQGMNAYGQVTDAIYGNNVVSTHYGYDGTTDYLDGISSPNGANTGNPYQSLTYSWEANGDLLSRASGVTSMNSNPLSETFNYDLHNRVTQSQVTNGNGAQTAVTYTYDIMGGITNKSDVGAYGYGPSVNVPAAGPHAVTAVAGTVNGSYAYDANGNMTCRSYTSTCTSLTPNITWNSDNLATSITQGGYTSSFSYAPDKHRYKQTATMATGTETTIYAGGMEQVTDTSGKIQYRVTISAYGRPVMLDTLTNGTTLPQNCPTTSNPSGNPVECRSYLLTDHLGSVDTVVADSGSVMPQESFDAFGKRRDSGSWKGSPTATTVAQARTVTHRGFTHHEHLDNLTVIDGNNNTIDGVVHMNGRLEDPVIGRMLSVDPVFQAPSNAQSVNPYSYVMNNPLSLVDPSGYASACSDGDATACPNALAHGDRLYKGHNDTGTMDHLGGEKLAHFDAAVKAKLTNATGVLDHGAAAIQWGNGKQGGQQTWDLNSFGKISAEDLNKPSATMNTTNAADHGGGTTTDAAEAGSSPADATWVLKQVNSAWKDKIKVTQDGDTTVITADLTVSGKHSKEAADEVNSVWNGKSASYQGKKYRINIKLTSVRSGGDWKLQQFTPELLGEIGRETNGFEAGGYNDFGHSKGYLSDAWNADGYILAHEFGHALGLTHAPGGSGSIMSYDANRAVTGRDMANLAGGYKSP